MYDMLVFAITVAAGVGGFMLARNFVRRRLRFVDAVHAPMAPVVAGLGAALVALPAALLPLIATGAVLTFGLGTGLGTRSGAKALKRGD